MMTDDPHLFGLPMTIIHSYTIPNECFPTFWEVLAAGGYFTTGATYGRFRNEVRGFAAGGGAISVPLWARVVLWWKHATTGRPAVVYDRKRAEVSR